MNNWNSEAQLLGFSDEREMLTHMYVKQNFSLSQMSQMLGFCTWSIRVKLLKLGIPLKARGGASNSEKRRRLKTLTWDELTKRSAKDVAAFQEVSVSTVYNEINRRKKEKRDEIRRDHADKLLSRVGGET